MTDLLVIPKTVVDFEVRNNEDWHDALAYYTPSNDPVSLADIYFSLEMRRHAADKSALVSITSVYQGGITVQNDNELHIHVPEERMSVIPCTENGETYVFDMVASDADNTRVIMTGTVKVILGVTR